MEHDNQSMIDHNHKSQVMNHNESASEIEWIVYIWKSIEMSSKGQN